jgi:hypothetical protein
MALLMSLLFPWQIKDQNSSNSIHNKIRLQSQTLLLTPIPKPTPNTSCSNVLRILNISWSITNHEDSAFSSTRLPVPSLPPNFFSRSSNQSLIAISQLPGCGFLGTPAGSPSPTTKSTSSLIFHCVRTARTAVTPLLVTIAIGMDFASNS